MTAKVPQKQPVTAEDADAEIDALLARIPDKYRAASTAKDQLQKKKRAASSWKCEPVTAMVGTTLLIGVSVLVFLSMSPKPFWAFQELHGNWLAEPQSAASRRAAADALDDDFMIHCEAPAVVRSLHAGEDDTSKVASADNAAEEESDKLVGTLPEAACRFTLGPFRVAAARMVFQPIRANSAVWTWTGPCVDGAPSICTITIHRKHTIFVAHDEHTRTAHSFLLTRWDTRRLGGDGLAGFWKEKGRFIVLIVSLIVGLKFCQYILSPKEDVGKKLREERFRRALEQRQKALRGSTQ